MQAGFKSYHSYCIDTLSWLYMLETSDTQGRLKSYNIAHLYDTYNYPTLIALNFITHLFVPVQRKIGIKGSQRI